MSQNPSSRQLDLQNLEIERLTEEVAALKNMAAAPDSSPQEVGEKLKEISRDIQDYLRRLDGAS